MFYLAAPLYDPLRFSFYGVSAPDNDEIMEIHEDARQLFALNEMLPSGQNTKKGEKDADYCYC